jgi:hypothetical protein
MLPTGTLASPSTSTSSNVEKARKAAPGNQDLVDFYNVDEPPAYAPAREEIRPLHH